MPLLPAAMRRSPLLFAVVLFACGPRRESETSPSSDGSADASSSVATSSNTATVGTSGSNSPTSDVSSGSTDSASTDTTPDTTGGTSSTCEQPDPARPGWSCNLWDDDCPSGEKCHATLTSDAACVELIAEPLSVGSECDPAAPLDPCERGAFCFSGVCHGYCGCSEAAPTCQDPCSRCLVTASFPAICSIPCDPLTRSCPGTFSCHPLDGEFHCYAPSLPDIQPGAPCTGAEGCSEGALCVLPSRFPGCEGEQGCCSPLCRPDDVTACTALLGPGATCEPLDDTVGCPWASTGVCLGPA